VCPVIRQQQRRASGLLLSAVRAEVIDRLWQVPRQAFSSNGAAANAGSVMLTVCGYS